MQQRSARSVTISFWAGVFLVPFLALSQGMAQDPAQISYDGTLGASHIGLTLIVKGGNAITGGHYYYARYYTDIPVTGSMQASGLALKGQDGGAFALKFIGNGSNGGKPLDFTNSVGLQGTWSQADKDLPVKLTMESVTGIPTSGRRYEVVTDQSDAAFEARVQGFYKAALTGDRVAIAKYVDFPLRINQDGKSYTVKSAAELTAHWEQIFTPAYIAALKKNIPHDLGIVQGQAILGQGEAYFGSKGATALNLP